MPKVATPRKKRAPNRNFNALIQAAPPSPISMPLTHVTDGFRFRSILGTNTLTPGHCTVFEEDLLYFFYGRPAYRFGGPEQNNGLASYWPVCFVIDPEVVKARRIYPFDSGAFGGDRFADFLHNQMIKEDFELDPDPSMPGRLVRLFWRDEEAYFNVDGASGYTPGIMDFEAASYSELIRHRGNAPFDDRNSAVEIQTDLPVELKGNTLAVILPQSFADDSMLAKIEEIGAVALPFDAVHRQHSNEMVGQIFQIVRDLLRGKHSRTDGRGRCW